MVTITNGDKMFRVPAGSVKPYKSMGFRVVSEQEAKELEEAEKEFVGNDEDSSDNGSVDDGQATDPEPDEPDSNDSDNEGDNSLVAELLEKPLSQWSNDEIKEFVRIKGIDTSSAQKVSQVRGIIKSYLEELQKNTEV